MKTPQLRFWAVEHLSLMIAAIPVLAHVGRARAKRAGGVRAHRLTVIFFGLALVAIMLGIPWPGTEQGRPLVRWPW